jgi:glyoxylase-like metal-dependent hydrolase (beta-lactamase superfamily II)
VKVEVVLAPNPGPYTGPGTNSYVISDGGEALVLDPGPILSAHEAAIVAALGSLTPVGVVATHTHPDHAPMCNPLAERLGVPVLGWGPGPAFDPDIRLTDGGTIAVGTAELGAVHTPGHTADHLCFLLGARLFTGDHIMSGSTVIIEDAAAYLDSLYLVRDLGIDRLEPGHGPARDDAAAVIDEYISHRRMRERQLLDAVHGGARTIGDLVDEVYAEVPADLRPAALHQVHVQLVKLAGDGWIYLGAGGTDPSATVEPSERAFPE